MTEHDGQKQDELELETEEVKDLDLDEERSDEVGGGRLGLSATAH